MKRVWLVLPDQLSIRIFFDAGIVDGLRDRLGPRLAAVFLVSRRRSGRVEPAARRCAGALRRRARGAVGEPRRCEGRRLARPRRSATTRSRSGSTCATGSTWSGCSRAIRTGCSTPTATGRCRTGASLERAMQRWHFSAHRHVPRRLLETMERECSALVLSNVQPHAAVPFLVAARRLGLPVIAHVASWDHTVGKGVISPHCDLYIVQNRVMEDDLRRYHDIGPERVRVTGWPQTDIFRRSRPRADYEALLRRYGLDPGRPLVLYMGNTPTNAPYEGRFVQRLLSWWEESARERFQLLFRPHPRDREWRERFGEAAGKTRRLRAGAELHRPRGAHGPPPARGCSRHQRGDDPARRARQRTPGRVRSLRRRRSSRRVVGGEERRRRALPGARGLRRILHGRELRARWSPGIERALDRPEELADARRRAVREVVGEVDGRAAERVVDAIAGALIRQPSAVRPAAMSSTTDLPDAATIVSRDQMRTPTWDR